MGKSKGWFSFNAKQFEGLRNSDKVMFWDTDDSPEPSTESKVESDVHSEVLIMAIPYS